MLKLIVSDIDGTLLPYGATALDPELFSLIHALGEAGIRFCPASGRQFHSLRRLFAPVAEELTYLCENGAILYGPGREEDAPVLGKIAMPREPAVALCRDVLALPGCDLLVTGANTAYLCRCGPEYLSLIRDVKQYQTVILDDPGQIPEDILKVAIYCPQGTAAPAEALGPRWGEAFSMAAAGPDWLDFTLADKGKGLACLCAALGVTPAETAAFGDNWNDAAMLELAGEAWLMEGSDPALAARFPRSCRRVEDVLREILNSLG